MKRILTCIFSIAVFLPAVTAFSQAIPPRSDSEETENVPITYESSKDTPGKPGCYVIDGGLTFGYEKGNYYKEKYDRTDSEGNSFSWWGIKLNPTAEFFLFNQVAFGAMAEFGFEKLGADKLFMIGIGPIASVYITKYRMVIPYFSVFGLYEHENTFLSSTNSMYWTDQALKAGVRGGAIFMLSRQGGLFIEGKLTYGRHKVSTPPATSQTKKTGWAFESAVGVKYFMF